MGERSHVGESYKGGWPLITSGKPRTVGGPMDFEGGNKYKN